MAKRVLTVFLVIYLAYMFIPFLLQVEEYKELTPLAEKYVVDGPEELGAANLVTSVIVTYRGLDTLGEVVVLFIATVGIGFLLRKRTTLVEPEKRVASEILQTGSDFLIPLLILFGVYIFLHGHLTPGGGFQGGVILASAALLYILAYRSARFNKLVVDLVESISGFSFVILGLLGLVLAGGFLDNRFLPLGETGKLVSAGAIPLIYSFIGLKVGMELIGIINKLHKDEV